MTNPIPLADLDHELSQLMRLHDEMRSWRWRFYPTAIKRAAAVAYAAHVRVLLEFFRNGRSGADLARIGCPKRNDLSVADLVSSGNSRDWTDDELRRLCDGDKLLGHLSKDRGTRTSDWGRDSDWVLLKGDIDKLLNSINGDLPESRIARSRLP